MCILIRKRDFAEENEGFLGLEDFDRKI